MAKQVGEYNWVFLLSERGLIEVHVERFVGRSFEELRPRRQTLDQWFDDEASPTLSPNDIRKTESVQRRKSYFARPGASQQDWSPPPGVFLTSEPQPFSEHQAELLMGSSGIRSATEEEIKAPGTDLGRANTEVDLLPALRAAWAAAALNVGERVRTARIPVADDDLGLSVDAEYVRELWRLEDSCLGSPGHTEIVRLASEAWEALAEVSRPIRERGKGRPGKALPDDRFRRFCAYLKRMRRPDREGDLGEMRYREWARRHGRCRFSDDRTRWDAEAESLAIDIWCREFRDVEGAPKTHGALRAQLLRSAHDDERD